jgi:glycerophosphoryl diester phosphodiesterase
MKLIGHRGAMAIEPENTLRSFKEALRHPFISMVELDVYCLPSGELVVIHDDDLDRTTNGKGPVMKATFSHIRTLDAGKGEKVPILEEVLDLIDKKVEVNVELKGPNTAHAVVACLQKYFKKGWKPEHFLVSSFDHPELEKFHKLMPAVRIGVLVEKEAQPFIKYAADLGAFSINPCIDYTNQELVDDAHKHNLKVFVWTIKKPEQATRMNTLGVDGIFVNDPEMVYKTLNK